MTSRPGYNNMLLQFIFDNSIKNERTPSINAAYHFFNSVNEKLMILFLFYYYQNHMHETGKGLIDVSNLHFIASAWTV